MAVSKLRCPEGHITIQKRGMTPSRTGPKQRYLCVTCGRTFFDVKPKRKSRAKKSD